MQGYVVLFFVFCLLPRMAGATVAGNSIADTRYFTLSVCNREYMPDDRAPTRRERVIEVAEYWRGFLQAYRTIDPMPSLRDALAKKPPSFMGYYDEHNARLYRYFSPYGITARMITRQPTGVYTLQVAAFSRKQNLTTLLQRIPRKGTSGFYPGTSIYDQTSKYFRLGYGDESIAYKSDPLYVISRHGFTLLRYGIYENAADARRDAVEWKTRYGIKPLVTRIPFTNSLVHNVLWGELPGGV